jgi:HAD superfamily hydrolase (TIGR01509 family)
MDSPKAWLIDVYGTVLRVDFGRVYEGLADVAGVPADMFRVAFGQVVDDVMTRKGGGPGAMARVLSVCGVEPSQRLVDELVAEDLRLLIDHARVFEDAVDFLHRLRAVGASSALVSNCGDHTRGLLVHFGFDALVDEFVLSSEVGFLKPDARIFQFALDRLGVAPESAVFVDDKVSFCRAARAVGVGAVHLVRQAGRVGSDSVPGDPRVVTSFAHLALG